MGGGGGVTCYSGSKAESVSRRDKLRVVQLVETGTKLPFLVSCVRRLTSLCPEPLNTSIHFFQNQEGEAKTRELTWQEIRTVTVDGGDFCGIQRRESFLDELDAVGVSSLFDVI